MLMCASLSMGEVGECVLEVANEFGRCRVRGCSSHKQYPLTTLRWLPPIRGQEGLPRGGGRHACVFGRVVVILGSPESESSWFGVLAPRLSKAAPYIGAVARS